MIDKKEFTFGVSGLLYKSNLLMYDKQTESLWSQVKMEAVAGPLTGTKLHVIPFVLTTWGKWKKRFPKTEVLSLDTGYTRDYSSDPYKDYYRSKRGFFSFFRTGVGEKEKELVAGVRIAGATKAYPIEYMMRKGTLKDSVGGVEIELVFDKETDTLAIHTKGGKEVPYITVYWFVWKGIHQGSEIFRPKP